MKFMKMRGILVLLLVLSVSLDGTTCPFSQIGNQSSFATGTTLCLQEYVRTLPWGKGKYHDILPNDKFFSEKEKKGKYLTITSV